MAAITMNRWETSALDFQFSEQNIRTQSAAATTATLARRWIAAPKPSTTHDRLIYPGLYAPSGIDIMSVLFRIAGRPNPTVHLGPIDCSVCLVVCDLEQADRPIIYASDSFYNMTGYNAREVIGKNCRALQLPGGMCLPPTPTADEMPAKNFINRTMRSTPTKQPPLLDPLLPGEVFEAEVIGAMRDAVRENTEFQTEVTNYKKNGQSFVNMLSIIPIRWDSPTYRYSVGFMCEKED